MRYANFVSRVSGLVLVPFALGAIASTAVAQEPIQIEPPAQMDAPPTHVLEPKGSAEAPDVDAGASGADGSVTDVVVPEGAQPAPMEPMEAAAPVAPAEMPAAETEARGAAPDVATLAQLVGKDVVDSKGEKVGMVTDVKMNDSGGVKEIHVRTGGFFGFGAKTLVVPSNVIAQAAKAVQLKIVSTDLTKLSVVKPPKS